MREAQLRGFDPLFDTLAIPDPRYTYLPLPMNQIQRADTAWGRVRRTRLAGRKPTSHRPTLRRIPTAWCEPSTPVPDKQGRLLARQYKGEERPADAAGIARGPPCSPPQLRLNLLVRALTLTPIGSLAPPDRRAKRSLRRSQETELWPARPTCVPITTSLSGISR